MVQTAIHQASSPKVNAAKESGVVIFNVPCETTVFVKAVVQMQASGIVKNALADSLANSVVLGICIAKQTTTLCTVRLSGVTETVFTGLDVLEEYFLSETTAGEITTTPPTGSGEIVLKIGIPFSATRLVIDKGNRFERA